VRNGRFGPYVQHGEDPTEKNAPKPKRATLFKDMDPATVGLDDAVQLLQLPRTVGVAEDGVEVVVANGRFGPFVRKGDEIRSLETEQQLLTLTMPEALELLAQPKRRRGQGAPKGPLRELGPDPVSGKPLVIKDGRFGPYVTDGETNASLRKGDSVEELSMERALELLQDRRDRGPATKGRRKAPAKKPAAAKTAAAATKKPAAKKAAAKKPAAKKPAAKKPAAKKAPAKKPAAADGSATPGADATTAEPAGGTE
ncbi:MAG: topoisomerase C-terminal repeat-containing protein, partial [Acidimicrobiia bacterium]